MAITERDRTLAEARMREEVSTLPTAIDARYDEARGSVLVTLNDGQELAINPRLLEGLDKATPEELSLIQISPSGQGLYWPAVDVGLYVPALRDGIYGSKRWMAKIAADLAAVAGDPARQDVSLPSSLKPASKRTIPRKSA